MTFDIKTMGERIRELRKAKNISTEALADSVGVTSNTFGFYERGERLMPVDTVIQVAEILDCDVTYLIDSGQTKPKRDVLNMASLTGITYNSAFTLWDIARNNHRRDIGVLNWFIEHGLIEYLHEFQNAGSAEEHPIPLADMYGFPHTMSEDGIKTLASLHARAWIDELTALVNQFVEYIRQGGQLEYADENGETIQYSGYDGLPHVIQSGRGDDAKCFLW